MPEHAIPRKRLSLIAERIYQVLTLGCMAVWLASSGISSFGAKHLFGIPLELTEGYALITVAVIATINFVFTSSWTYLFVSAAFASQSFAFVLNYPNSIQ